MGILRSDRVSGLGGANAIKGSVEMRGAQNLRAEIVNGNADFNLGISDFTIECWYNPSGTSGTGNSQDFGDLTDDRGDLATSSDCVRGVFSCGRSAPGPSVVNTMDYITIMTEGNAVDFGDATIAISGGSGCSNGHGGLG